MPQLVLLRTSPRVAPGQLSAQAWSLLRSAAAVVAPVGHVQIAAMAAAGVVVEVQDRALAPDELAELLRGQLDGAPGDVVWLCAADGDTELERLLGDSARVVIGSVDLPGARVLDLVAVMDRLRSPGGCPWDAAQTHATLLPYLLEEAYETVEAVETDDVAGLREELGDVLLQVVFHARVGEEDAERPWSLDDVAAAIVDKLVARHPHVFGDADADTAAQVEANWEVLKRAEKGRTSAVDGVPLGQPALALAAKLMARADRAGVAVPVPDVPAEPETADELGDLLLSVVARARARGIDPEAALREAARRYAAAVRAAEASR